MSIINEKGSDNVLQFTRKVIIISYCCPDFDLGAVCIPDEKSVYRSMISGL